MLFAFSNIYFMLMFLSAFVSKDTQSESHHIPMRRVFSVAGLGNSLFDACLDFVFASSWCSCLLAVVFPL